MKEMRKLLVAGAAGPLAAVLVPLTVAQHLSTTTLQETCKLRFDLHLVDWQLIAFVLCCRRCANC